MEAHQGSMATWQEKQSKKCIELTLALTSPPPHPLLTLAHPRLTTHSPSTHPRRARICWRVPTLTPSSIVQNLIREAISNSTRPAMWADPHPWPAIGYIWALALPALNQRSSVPLPPVSPVSTATSCSFCLPPPDWPLAGSFRSIYLVSTNYTTNGSTGHRRRAAFSG
jgi:hypothetical protein